MPINLSVDVTIKLHDHTVSVIRDIAHMIVAAINRNTRSMETMSGAFQAAMEDLKTDVQGNTDVVQSAIVLINGIADRIDAASGDPNQVRALSAELRAQHQALADAVDANTPKPTPPQPNPNP